jgi:hypothetical protein
MSFDEATLWLLLGLSSATALMSQQVSQPQPNFRPTLSVHRATSTSSGLSLEITVSNAAQLDCGVWNRIAEKNGIPYIGDPITRSMTLDLPTHAKNTTQGTDSTVVLPIALAPDPTKNYTVSCTAEADDAIKSDPSSAYFSGYSTLVAQTINFAFTADGLQISAKTGTKNAELYAKWAEAPAAEEAQIQWSAQVPLHEDPSLTLSYENISPRSRTGTVPLVVALRSEEGGLQEARITIAAQVPSSSTPPAGKKKGSAEKKQEGLVKDIKSVQNSSTPDAKKNKVTFSWKTIASTGLGAFMKYFVTPL